MGLTSQQTAELAFWKGLVEEHGEFYYAYRVAEYRDKVQFFPHFLTQVGLGLDLGCGCISVFEGSSKVMTACDVLADEYAVLLDAVQIDDLRVDMLRTADVLKRAVLYDWVACINMIDHTPDASRLLSDLEDVLMPGAKLYFEVNLEAGLAAPHHTVWTEQTVREVMHPFFAEQNHFIQDVPEHNQRRYWAEMISRKK